MSNLYYAAYYKRQIIRLLKEHPDFTAVMNQGQFSDCTPPDGIPSAEQTFAAVDVCIDAVRQNTCVDYSLYVYLYTNRNLATLDGQSSPSAEAIREMGYCADETANRIDVLCDIVDRILNGTDKLPGIGKTEPAPEEYVTNFCPADCYYGKRLKYKISNCNEEGDGYGI